MIDIKDLQKVVEGRVVLDLPALRVEGGEVAAFVGPVDSGIDILFELLIGSSRPTMGSISLAGIDPYGQKAQFSRSVGVLFADDNLYKRLTVRANLEFYSRLHHLPSKRVQEVVAQVGLGDQSEARMDSLSSSMVRRLAFGRAILQQPEVLFLAEPFAKCDEACITLLSRLIREQAGAGAAVLILISEPSNLNSLCDMIYHMEGGRIVDAYKPGEETQPELPFMIPARLEGKVALVDPAEILFIYAQDDRAYLQTSGESLPTQFTLTELETRLSRSGFFRAHRGYLVNLQHVKEIIPYTRDSYSLRLKDASRTEIPLSKSAAKDLRELLGY